MATFSALNPETKKMADKGQVQTTQGQPLMKIGYYILGETLGVGTFGKVKSKFYWNNLFLHLIIFILYHFLLVSPFTMCVSVCKQQSK